MTPMFIVHRRQTHNNVAKVNKPVLLSYRKNKFRGVEIKTNGHFLSFYCHVVIELLFDRIAASVLRWTCGLN